MKGVVLYDRREGAFTIAEHNLEDSEIGEVLSRYRGQGLPAYEFSHPRRHGTPEADLCRACARIVRNIIARAGNKEV